MEDVTSLNKIIEEIKLSKKSLVLAHQNPDGDTLGSMLALGIILKDLGHEVFYSVSDPVPEIYKFLPYTNFVKLPNNIPSNINFDLAFSLDCGSVKRLGMAQLLWQKAKKTINIDHHISNERFADINLIEADATSTGQVVYWLAKSIKAKITPEIATLLYVTLLTDTGCFAHSNTNSRALNWGAELIELGAKHIDVYRKVFLERPFKSIKIFGAALNNMTFLIDKKVIFTYVDNQTMKLNNATNEDTEDIADYMMRSKDVQVGVFFREEDGETKVSLRSNIDFFDVSKIAMSLGGGGHKRAAGINIKKTFSEVKEIVLNKVLEEYNGQAKL